MLLHTHADDDAVAAVASVRNNFDYTLHYYALHSCPNVLREYAMKMMMIIKSW